MHGDAAFAGQGILAETLNLADLKGYTVGGTVHIVVNNLIGFTTPAIQEHSSRFASDIAKRQSIPVFHVNAEDPDAVVRIGRLAAEYRAKFGSDVVVDLIGYRRHGHSEVDDPTITQPQKYEAIKNHAPLWKIYAEKTGIDATAVSDVVRKEYEGEQTKAKALKKMPHLRQLPSYWTPYLHGKSDVLVEPETGVAREKLEEITDGLMRVPAGFHLHPKLAKLLEQRAEMGHGKRAIDYGFAEAARVRLAGARRHADSAHGTGFAARHVQPAARGPDRRARPNTITCRCRISRASRRFAKSITRRSPRLRASASSTASVATIPKRSFCGKRSSATS